MGNLYTTQQLQAEGIGRARINSMLIDGTLVRICRGVYSRGAPTPEAVINYIRSHKPFATFTGATAQAHHEGRPHSFPIEIEVPRGRATLNNQYIRTRTSRNAHTKAQSNNVLSPLETVRALGTQFDPGDRRIFLANTYTGKEGQRALEQHIASTTRLGRAIKNDLKHSPTGCDSNTERRFFQALSRSGLTLKHNVQIGPYRYDGVIEKHKLIIEIDGRQFHNSTSQMLTDRWKSNLAQLHGYRILRYTDLCLDTEFDACLSQVLTATKSRPHQHLRHTELTGLWRWHSGLIHLQREERRNRR